MVPQYQLQQKQGDTWKDVGKANHRHAPVREAFVQLAKALQDNNAYGHIRVTDTAKSWLPVYDEWERTG